MLHLNLRMTQNQTTCSTTQMTTLMMACHVKGERSSQSQWHQSWPKAKLVFRECGSRDLLLSVPKNQPNQITNRITSRSEILHVLQVHARIV